MRRVERELIGEYEELVERGADAADARRRTPPRVELLELPDLIRGYEDIKLRNVALYRKRAEAIRKRLRSGKPAPQILSP